MYTRARPPATGPLCRAIEDDAAPEPNGPVLFAAFQQRRFFLQSQRRWNELARTARIAVVFADFGEAAAAGGPPPGPAPVRVPLPADARPITTGVAPIAAR